MGLPILDVSKFLTKRNNQPELLSKYQSLLPSAVKTLTDANNYYYQIPHTFIGLSGKDSKSHQKDLIESAKELDSSKFKENKKLYLKDVMRKKMHEWQVKQNKLLSSDSEWKKLQDSCKTIAQQNKLNLLKGSWFKQARFSFYTSKALLETAENYIPVFENYLNLLRSEYQTFKNQLHWSDKKHIKNYMAVLTASIQKERQELAEAMLVRLKVASSSKDSRNDDVTYHLASTLKEMGLLKKNYSLPEQPRRDLDMNTFHAYQRFINRYGSKEQVNHLSALNCHKSDEKYVVINKKSSFIVVPKEFEKNIQPPSFLSKLFGQDKSQFFKQHFDLITQLRFPPKPKDEFRTLFDFYQNNRWQELCQLAKDIVVKLELVEKQRPTGFWGKIFSSEKRKFLSSWQLYLADQQKLIINEMLEYAAFITSQLKTRHILGLDQEELCSKHFQSHLRKFNEDLSVAINGSAVLASDLPAYQDILSYVEKTLALPGELERLKGLQLEEQKRQTQVTDECSDWHSPTGDQSTILIPLSEDTEETTADNPFAPIPEDDCSRELHIVLSKLIPKESVFNHQSKEFNELVTHLEAVYEVHKLNNSHRLRIEGELEKTINTLFEVYLQTWISTKEEEKEVTSKGLSAFAEVLSQIGPKLIGDHIQDLQKILAEYGWFAFQAKCHGLLISLGNTSLTENESLKTLESLLPSSKISVINSADYKSIHRNTSSFFFLRERKEMVEKETLPVVLAY